MGFFDDIKWGDVISSAVPAVVQAGAGILQSGADQDREDATLARQEAAQDKDQYLQLRLAALKAQYAGGSGGGGGGGGTNPNQITLPEKVAAIQGQGETEQSAINNLITAIQNGYSLSGGR